MPTVYVTAPEGSASELARSLVDERLAACVNQVNCRSTYRWEGDVVEDEEVILLAKTTSDRYDQLATYVREHHPYDTPCVERFDEADVDEPFAAWREACCRPVETGE